MSLSRRHYSPQRSPRGQFPYAARGPPAAPLVLGLPRRLPGPRPLEGHRGAPAGAEVADELDIGVLMQVRIGMELARDQVLDLAGRRGVDVGEAVDGGVGSGAICVGGGGGGGRRRCLRRLPDDEGEGEGKLVVVDQLKDEGRGSQEARRLGVLAGRARSARGRVREGRGEQGTRGGDARTWTNSTGLSPAGRDADTLVAGYALGTMLTDGRLAGLLMTRLEMDTVADTSAGRWAPGRHMRRRAKGARGTYTCSGRGGTAPRPRRGGWRCCPWRRGAGGRLQSKKGREIKRRREEEQD